MPGCHLTRLVVQDLRLEAWLTLQMCQQEVGGAESSQLAMRLQHGYQLEVSMIQSQ